MVEQDKKSNNFQVNIHLHKLGLLVLGVGEYVKLVFICKLPLFSLVFKMSWSNFATPKHIYPSPSLAFPPPP